MAIIDGKRYLGLQFYKEMGKHQYLFVDTGSFYIPNGRYEFGVGTLIDIDTKDPRPYILRLRVNAGCGLMVNISPAPRYLQEDCREITWKKIPPQWQEIFMQHLGSSDEWNKNREGVAA